MATGRWKKIEDTFIRFDRIYERDGRTDGRTPHDGALCTASRGKNGKTDEVQHLYYVNVERESSNFETGERHITSRWDENVRRRHNRLYSRFDLRQYPRRERGVAYTSPAYFTCWFAYWQRPPALHGYNTTLRVVAMIYASDCALIHNRRAPTDASSGLITTPRDK